MAMRMFRRLEHLSVERKVGRVGHDETGEVCGESSLQLMGVNPSHGRERQMEGLSHFPTETHSREPALARDGT